MRTVTGQHGGQVEAATGGNSRRATRFSDCETDDDVDDDDDDDDDVYMTSSTDNCSDDEFEMRRRSRRSQGKQHIPVINR